MLLPEWYQAAPRLPPVLYQSPDVIPRKIEHSEILSGDLGEQPPILNARFGEVNQKKQLKAISVKPISKSQKPKANSQKPKAKSYKPEAKS